LPDQALSAYREEAPEFCTKASRPGSRQHTMVQKNDRFFWTIHQTLVSSPKRSFFGLKYWFRKTKFDGYARVSTKDQTVDLQVDALKKAGCTKV
jgi:hypothetical protein